MQSCARMYRLGLKFRGESMYGEDGLNDLFVEPLSSDEIREAQSERVD